ncbi:hypothetical protein POM88_049988 [Heracleum sosnowskyi]|uniref:HMA domain-containing protein n=1 Tax=Heracleum sosnowskyi TaxID=360622 RepID=A0AAD8M238_9APIA|nr:hypothetical protein POM88_049988 [Heracleum sosnowskyi]
MAKHLPDSIFVFKSSKLHCLVCIETVKKFLLKRPDIAEVDGDLEKKRVIIKGNVDIVTLITIVQKIKIDAELIYYKEGRWGDPDQRTENCAKYHEKRNMFKDHGQKTKSRGKKEKQGSCDHDEAEDIGADHYKIRNTFKDHKPEAYVPPKQEFFWGDVQSGMHQKFPSIPGAGSRFTAGFPNYHGFY